MGSEVWEFKICSFAMHATLEEPIVYVPTFSISFSPILLVLTRWVMKAESRIRSLSTRILWLNMEMRIDHLSPKLIFQYWATHLIQSKKRWNRTLALLSLHSSLRTEGAVVSWEQSWMALAKNHALAPTLVWLFMFLYRFNQDWSIYKELRLLYSC